MKRYFLFIGFVALSTCVLAQEQQIRFSPVNSIFFDETLEATAQNPSNYLYLPMEDYTASSLFYKFENGDYKQGGTPESTHDFGVSTQGISRNEKGILFFGDFFVQKSYYENLKWNLSYQLPDRGLMEDPHYFAVSKGAKWSNQEFKIEGGMFLPLLQEKLQLLVKVDYDLFNKYRTDLDPRPKITYNELGTQGGINYQLTKNHHLKLGGEYGFTHIHNQVRFSNIEQNLPKNFDLYVRWVAGYASLPSPSKNATERRFTHRGFNLGYAFTSEKNTLLADFSFRSKEQITYKDEEIENPNDKVSYFAVYTPQTMEISLSGFHAFSEEKLLKAEVFATLMEAENNYITKGGKTYAAKANSLAIALGYLKQVNGMNHWDLGTEVSLWQVEQQDALASTSSDYSNVEVQLHALKSFRIYEDLILSPFAEVGFRYNLTSEFINGNENYLQNIADNDFAGLALRDYYQEVLYPDNEMFGSHALDFTAGASLNFISSNNLSTLLKIQAGMQRPTEKLQYFEQEQPQRLYASASLTLFY